MSYTPVFPPSNQIISYFDYAKKRDEYLQLISKRGPIKYPFRMAAVAAGVKGTNKNFDEINPSMTKEHVYLAYLGFKPGFLYYIWHQYDQKILKWDEDINDIDEDLVASDYETSPYESPALPLLILHDRYPGIQAKNVSGESKHPEVVFIATGYKYKVITDERARYALGTGDMKSVEWEAGGEW